MLARFLEEWGFTPEQASLFASTVLCEDAEGSADWVRTNAFNVNGSWVRESNKVTPAAGSVL